MENLLTWYRFPIVDPRWMDRCAVLYSVSAWVPFFSPFLFWLIDKNKEHINCRLTIL